MDHQLFFFLNDIVERLTRIEELLQSEIEEEDNNEHEQEKEKENQYNGSELNIKAKEE